MKIEIYRECRGVEEILDARVYSDDWVIEEVLREVLLEKWNNVDEVKRVMGEVLGEDCNSLNDVVEMIMFEKEGIDDGMGYRVDEEVYVRFIQ